MALLNIATLNPSLNVTVIKDWAGIQELIAWLKVNKEPALDLETPPVKGFWKSYVRLIQYGTKEKQFVIDLLAFVKSPEELMDAQGDYGVRTHKYTQLKEVIEAIR